MSRGIVEEVARAKTDEWVLMSFFDIEKAYPRLCKDALWELAGKRGCPSGFINTLKALHEHTEYRIRVEGELSEGWMPDRRLREGCRSSPPLFNVYHDAVMEDFRARRIKAANEKGQEPGLRWCYKIHGRMLKKGSLKKKKDGPFWLTRGGNRR